MSDEALVDPKELALERAETKKKISKFENELKDVEAVRNEAQRKLKAEQTKSAGLETRLEKLERISAEAKDEERMKERNALREDVSRAHKAAVAAKKDSASKDAQIEELKKTVSALNRKLERIAPTLEAMQTARGAAQKREAEAYGGVAKLKAERDNARDEVKKLEGELAASEKERKRLEKDFEAAARKPAESKVS